MADLEKPFRVEKIKKRKNMKRIIFVVVLALGFAFSANAQAPLFKKGDKIGNIGIGFGSYGTPIEASMMWGMSNNVFGVKGLNFGLGAYLGLSFYNEDWFGYKYSHTIIVPGARGQLNYTFVKGLEAYAGLMLGCQIWTSSSNYPGDHSTGLGIGGYAGLRYYFNHNWGIYLEGGYGISNGTIGVSYKF